MCDGEGEQRSSFATVRIVRGRELTPPTTTPSTICRRSFRHCSKHDDPSSLLQATLMAFEQPGLTTRKVLELHGFAISDPCPGLPRARFSIVRRRLELCASDSSLRLILIFDIV